MIGRVRRDPLSSWPFIGRSREVERLLADVADAEVTGVVLTAPAGSGKTRLARTVTGSAALPPLWWQAAPAVAALPFGALAAVLGADDDVTPAAAYQRLAGLVRDAGGVVVVDDAPHLDPRSADLLRRLVDAGKATVVATARQGDPVPPWLEWLWLDERTRHHDVGPLDRAAVGELVAILLHDLPEVERTTVADALAVRSGGNPLFLRELLIDLRRRHLDGEPVAVDADAPPHLLRVLEARLRAAGPDVTAVVDAVAVLGSLPLAVLVGRCGPGAVEAAERAGYLVVEGDARSTVRPAHPLHAEAALAAMTAVARRRLTEEVARAVLSADTGPLRLGAVAALVEQGAEVGATDLLDATRTAFAALDHDLAARLAQAAARATTSGPERFEALVVLGAAHSGAGRAGEAEAALRDALALAATDDQRARAAGRLSVHLVAHGRRVDEAAALLDEVATGLTDPAAQAFLAADQAKLASIRGDVSALRATAPGDGGPADPDDPATLNTAIVGAYAEAMAGDAAACRATIAGALAIADRHRAVLPWAGELVRFSGVFASLVADGPGAAAGLAAAGVAESTAGSGATVGTWRYLFGFASAAAGDLSRAAGALAAATDELDGHDLIGARPLALSARAWVEAQAGRVDAARALLDGSVDAAVADARVRTQVAVADAWCDAVEGTTSRAVAKVVDAALEAADGGQVVPAVLVLHDLVRLGAAGSARSPLSTITGRAPSSWLLDFVVARAVAEADADEAALRRLADRARGRWPVAVAELHAVLGALAARRLDGVAAARHALSALRAMEGLGPVRPWSLREVVSPLTAREQEVAAAVVAGAGNREVAEAAGVSVRTVENQLQSVYRKLGLAGRTELAALLGPVTVGAAGA